MTIQHNQRLLALLAASSATVIIAYIFYPYAKGRRKRRKDRCVGLRNLGRTCFMNAILQALAPCHKVRDWLEVVTTKTCPRRVVTNASHAWLVTSLYNVWKVLNNLSATDCADDEYSPVDVLDALRFHGWQISPEEQDAHELFHVFTETLQDEVTRAPALVPLFDVASIMDEQTLCLPKQRLQPRSDADAHACAPLKQQQLLPVLPRRTANPFRGLLATQLQCTTCSYKTPVRYDTFDSLSLAIPSHHIYPVITLESLLQKYMSSERLNDVECDGCRRLNDGVPKKATFIKTSSIGKLPDCLCIHVQRTAWLSNGLPRKTRTPIQYSQFLAMAPFVYTNHVSKQKQQQRQFELQLRGSVSGLLGGANVLASAASDELRQSDTRSLSTAATAATKRCQPLKSQQQQKMSPNSATPESQQQQKKPPKSAAAEPPDVKSKSTLSFEEKNNASGQEWKSVSYPVMPQSNCTTAAELQEQQKAQLGGVSEIGEGAAVLCKPAGKPLVSGPVPDLTDKRTAVLGDCYSGSANTCVTASSVNVIGAKSRDPTELGQQQLQQQKEQRRRQLRDDYLAQRMQYKLMSVVEHHGDVMSGHFVTFRRAPSSSSGGGDDERVTSEQWLLTSDTHVRKVSRQEALAAEAYLLFYERM